MTTCPYKERNGSDQIYCNVCNESKTIKTSNPCYHCSECDYDCCSSCYEKKQKKLNPVYEICNECLDQPNVALEEPTSSGHTFQN